MNFGPEKILIVLAVALIVLGPERLPGMTRQIGKAWGDFRRFREHLEGEVRGALGDDVMPQFTPPWQQDGSAVSAATPDGAGPQGASPSDGSASGEGAQDRAPSPDPGHPAQLPRATGSPAPGTYGGWHHDLAPDDPSLN